VSCGAIGGCILIVKVSLTVRKQVVSNLEPLDTVSGVTEALKVFDKPCRMWAQETVT